MDIQNPNPKQRFGKMKRVYFCVARTILEKLAFLGKS
jgi:hypothetical protein